MGKTDLKIWINGSEYNVPLWSTDYYWNGIYYETEEEMEQARQLYFRTIEFNEDLERFLNGQEEKEAGN